MTQRRIRWTVRASPRFDQIVAYIEKDDPNAAAGVVTRLVAAVDMLAELPAAGRISRITLHHPLSASARHRDSYSDARLLEMAEKAVNSGRLQSRVQLQPPPEIRILSLLRSSMD